MTDYQKGFKNGTRFAISALRRQGGIEYVKDEIKVIETTPKGWGAEYRQGWADGAKSELLDVLPPRESQLWLPENTP